MVEVYAVHRGPIYTPSGYTMFVEGAALPHIAAPLAPRSRFETWMGNAPGQPLYKFWGRRAKSIAPYASMLRLSTPEEHADIAVKFKSE